MSSNPEQAWIDDGLLATIRAKSVSWYLRALIVLVVVLGAVGVFAVLADTTTEPSSKIAAVMLDSTLVAMCAGLLAALSSGLELLRVQTEATLFETTSPTPDRSSRASGIRRSPRACLTRRAVRGPTRTGQPNAQSLGTVRGLRRATSARARRGRSRHGRSFEELIDVCAMEAALSAWRLEARQLSGVGPGTNGGP